MDFSLGARIDQFRREQVGASHRAAGGPLRRAMIAADRARAAYQSVQEAHASYGGLLSRLGDLEEAEAAARAVLHRTEIARSKVEASRSRALF